MNFKEKYLKYYNKLFSGGSSGSWACSACTFMNNSSTSQCSMCATPKSAPAAGGGGGGGAGGGGGGGEDINSHIIQSWSCSVCTLTNNGSASNCEVCHNPKSVKPRYGFNPDDYFYHGTSSVYLPYILRDGLGKYPDELFDELEKLHNYSVGDFNQHGVATYKPGSPLYVPREEMGTVLPNGMFVINASIRHPSKIYDIQKKLRDSQSYETYFARDISFASAYGINGSAGDSATSLVKNLVRWVETNKDNEEIKLNPIWGTCNNLLRIFNPADKRQIIFAIKRSSIRNTEITGGGDVAIIKDHPIRPQDLYVCNSNPPGVTPLLTFLGSSASVSVAPVPRSIDVGGGGGGGGSRAQPMTYSFRPGPRGGQSAVIMPLIYSNLTDLTVTFPSWFETEFNKYVNQYNENASNFGLNRTPFTDFTGFKTWMKQKLNSYGIITREDILSRKNPRINEDKGLNEYHLSRQSQELLVGDFAEFISQLSAIIFTKGGSSIISTN